MWPWFQLNCHEPGSGRVAWPITLAIDRAQGRDMQIYGTELMATIETFVDRILDVLAANRPTRVGPLPT